MRECNVERMIILKKKFLCITLVSLLSVGLFACGSTNNSSTGGNPSSLAPTDEATVSPSATEDTSKQKDSASKAAQTSNPVKGDTVATITIKDFGEVKVKFFPEQAPKAVENFTTHAKEGYYNGLTFHRVMNDFMIQGGDPTGNGTGGESIWKQPFEDEFSEDLLPIRGALCMANAGANTNGSQFFIVQAKDCPEEYLSGLTETQKKVFTENGGTPWLTNQHTVFGQVYEGMDVVDAIAATEVDSSNDKPTKDVIIESITVKTYK